MTHTLIDAWKAAKGNRTSTFLADQLAHLAVLTVALFLLLGWTDSCLARCLAQAWTSPRLLISILGYIIVLWPVGRLMSVLPEPFRRQLAEEKSRGLETAGLWIGCLEQIFLLSFILAD